MAPSPTKRVTRSADAKDTRKRASRKATPIDSGYGGSEESWQSSIRNGKPQQDTSEDPLVRPVGAQSITLTPQGISLSRRKSIVKQPKPVPAGPSTRGPSLRGSPSKSRQPGNPIFTKAPEITMRPADKPPVQIPDIHYQHQADSEISQAQRYFSKPKNRNNQPALETFFNSLPSYPQTDAAYMYRYHVLRCAAWEWAKEYFAEIPPSSPPLNLMHLVENHVELMEYINATTSSPHSEVWEQILQLKRAEIVYSILGKVLEMHVFGREFFGATAEEEQSMQELDFEMRDSDGFSRHTVRSQLIATFLPQHTNLPTRFLPSLQTLLQQIYTLLHSLLPAPNPTSRSPHIQNFSTTLFTILLLATKLHHDIRRHPQQKIYYFPPSPTPGTTFDAEDMNVVNTEAMGKRMTEPLTRSALRAGKIKRVVGVGGWPGLVGYEAVNVQGRRHQNNDRIDGSGRSLEDRWKQRSGVLTHTLARADVFIEFEAVAPAAGAGGVVGRRLQRKSLKIEMRERVLRREERVKKGRVLKRAGVATAVAMGVGQGVRMWLGK